MYFMHDTIEMGVVVTGQCPCIVYEAKCHLK